MVKLQVKDLVFGYTGTNILKDVCLEIGASSLVSIVGPNGAGKSTLLKCIDRILNVKTGKIIVDDKDIKQMGRLEVAKNLAYVPQSSNRVFPTSVFETVMMGRRPHLSWFDGKKDEEKVWEVLEMLGIEDLSLSIFNELSGGQQQKVLIARALVQETGVILLDEPTSNLDIWHQLDVMETVRKLVREKQVTAIMAVHDLNLASRYSESIIMMQQGKIIAAGSPCAVLTSENIAEVYGVEARISTHAEVPYVVPLRQLEIA
ncbi:Vitamin B12 ABC transporter, ATPase component BtuD [Methanosarcina siciliae C2J]|uniref:Cobalamin import ATP-binding protein BtuD n=3 Tax=Methanosarcina siciliae TaxID=38027 RepID=A0A0E3PCH0_9EURY|nr:ABC transporter ATP-binding protein [Methanosarcina siciliae]AKB28214.1 Vitamin B12 ABC transporter, ATPase component BtuD [Methanosarcina siciliae T4/M]AKB32133.1 Vitamin B12 ABC transporter, ATPase component BtuD [Methanosarcina siciliae HI350]AKB36112.1 Vitamin B12 ABC transporter, ATPase component BtuD [Methanosarcina siciliae C2J]